MEQDMSVVKKKKEEVKNEKVEETPQDIDLNNVQWVDYTTSVAYKINVGDEVIFKPLEQPKGVKNDSAWVVQAYVYKWTDSTGKVVRQNETLTIYMQKVVANRVQDAITQYGLGNFVVYAKNKGRNNTRYYIYEVKIGAIR